MNPLLPTPVNLRPAGAARLWDVVWAAWGLALGAAAFALLLLVTSLGGRFGLVETLLVWPMRWFQLLASGALVLAAFVVGRTVLRVLRHIPATEVDVLPDEIRVRRLLGLAPVTERRIAVPGQKIALESGWRLRARAPGRSLFSRWLVRPDDAWALQMALQDRNRKIRAALLQVAVEEPEPPNEANA